VSGVLVLVDLVDGVPDRLSAEALGFAASLGAGEVSAAGVGAPGVGAAAGSLGGFGVRRAYVVEDAALEAYSAAASAAALAAIVAAVAPDVVITSGGERPTEILAHLAARLGQPMAANVIAATPGERWTIVRQRWAGSLLEEASLDGSPRLLTVAAHAVPQAEATAGAPAAEVVPVSASIAETDLVARVRTVERTAANEISLAEAKVVVGGGRGLGSAESFAMLDELAQLLGAAVGVSRVATSLGWRPHAQQVGQTGTRIAPDLYIACGISGAIQHMVGSKSSKRILAINTDRDAPIFLKATYGIIGDVHQVLPAITAEVRKAKGL
jgi:electron transfer flavoprotein alpha subunit